MCLSNLRQGCVRLTRDAYTYAPYCVRLTRDAYTYASYCVRLNRDAYTYAPYCKTTRHLKAHLVTRFLIGNKKGETRKLTTYRPFP